MPTPEALASQTIDALCRGEASALYRLDTTSIPLADASPLLDTHAGRTGRWIANTLKGTSDE